MQIKIRLVTEEDCYDLWSWRNHPVVRRGSFNTDEIGQKEHKIWFDKKY